MLRILNPEMQSRLATALDKARSYSPEVRSVTRDSYEVAGMGGTYEVRVFTSDSEIWVQCNCEAGENGFPCYHVGAVLIRRGVALNRRFDATVSGRMKRNAGSIVERALEAVRNVPSNAIVLNLSTGQTFQAQSNVRVTIEPR
jgi:hypothetical protein